ncbi:MAG: ATP-binding cassette domain-containing protein [Geodermatophilaceae bacterium]
MSGPLLAGLGLGVSFGETAALEDVSLSLSAGEVVAVMGTSGSGKSTLLHCLAGVLVPDRGEVSFAGERIDNQSDRRRSDLRLRSFGFVPQFGDLVPELTLLENVALPLRLLQVGRREATGRAAALLDELEVGSAASRRAGAASGGQVQRAAVAREPAGTTRLVAALLVALFVVAGGRCVLVAFETTPQYQRAALAASTGPQLAQLDVPEGSSLNAGVLADHAGCTRGRTGSPGRHRVHAGGPTRLPPGADRPSTCGEAFVGTCAQLAFFSRQITGCRDDQAAWLDRGYGEDFSEQVNVTPAQSTDVRRRRPRDPGTGRAATPGRPRHDLHRAVSGRPQLDAPGAAVRARDDAGPVDTARARADVAGGAGRWRRTGPCPGGGCSRQRHRLPRRSHGLADRAGLPLRALCGGRRRAHPGAPRAAHQRHRPSSGRGGTLPPSPFSACRPASSAAVSSCRPPHLWSSGYRWPAEAACLPEPPT